MIAQLSDPHAAAALGELLAESAAVRRVVAGGELVTDAHPLELRRRSGPPG